MCISTFYLSIYMLGDKCFLSEMLSEYVCVPLEKSLHIHTCVYANLMVFVYMNKIIFH